MKTYFSPFAKVGSKSSSNPSFYGCFSPIVEVKMLVFICVKSYLLALKG